MVDINKEDIIGFLKKASQEELSELSEEVAKTFGISKETITVSGASAANSEGKSQAKEEFNNVRLVNIGTEKIKVYGIIMEAINKSKKVGETINIVGAKRIVEEAAAKGEVILSNIPSEEAQKIEKELKKLGAEVKVEKI